MKEGENCCFEEKCKSSQKNLSLKNDFLFSVSVSPAGKSPNFLKWQVHRQSNSFHKTFVLSPQNKIDKDFSNFLLKNEKIFKKPQNFGNFKNEMNFTVVFNAEAQKNGNSSMRKSEELVNSTEDCQILTKSVEYMGKKAFLPPINKKINGKNSEIISKKMMNEGGLPNIRKISKFKINR